MIVSLAAISPKLPDQGMLGELLFANCGLKGRSGVRQSLTERVKASEIDRAVGGAFN